MVFTVDAGNTNIVIGAFDSDKKVVFTARLKTEPDLTGDQYAALIVEILRLYSIEKDEFSGAIISTVVPELVPALSHAIKLLFGINAMVVGKGVDSGLKVKGLPSEAIGADLVCGAVGAIEKYPPPLIIFDFGTATTVTAVDRDGVFCGGAILPGVKISLNALSSTAALLQDIDLSSPGELAPISLDTVVCMKSGVILGNASMMDGMIERYREELGQDATVVATGGLAGAIVPYCRTKGINLDKELLLTGLYSIYTRNK